jgi:excisionase family DNA binding protein
MRDLTISDVAKRLAISRARVKTLITSGRLKGYEIPMGKIGQLRVRESDLDQFREANRVGAPAYSHRVRSKVKVVDLLDG